MQKIKLVSSTFILLAFISGCDVLDKLTVSTKPSTKVEYSTEVKEMAKSMTGVDKDICILARKQFAGLAEYLQNSGKSIDTTPKVFKLIDSFQKDYSYTREGNKEYSDAIQNFLLKHGYLNPMMVVNELSVPPKMIKVNDSGVERPAEITRATIITDMRTLADAAKLALEAKNVK